MEQQRIGFVDSENIQIEKLATFRFSEVKIDRAKKNCPIVFSNELPDQPNGKYVIDFLDENFICEGSIRFGDELLEINGHPVKTKSLSELTLIIASAPSYSCLEVLVRNSFTYPSSAEEEIRIKPFLRESGSFTLGFSLSSAYVTAKNDESDLVKLNSDSTPCHRSGSTAKYVVSFVDPEGPAAGLLFVGDCILQINGVECTIDPQEFPNTQVDSDGNATVLVQRAMKCFRNNSTLYRVCFCKRSRLFGFSVRMSYLKTLRTYLTCPQITVSSIDANGIISKYYPDILKIGDEIIEIDGQSLSETCNVDAAKMIAYSGRTLSMKIRSFVQSSEKESNMRDLWSFWYVEFRDLGCQSKNLFEIELVTSVSDPQLCDVAGCLSHCYKIVRLDSSEIVTVGLRIGDIILMINGETLSSKNEASVKKMIAKNYQKMSILLIRSAEYGIWSIPDYENIDRTILHRDPVHGFGLGVMGGQFDIPVYISHVYPDSPAAKCPKIQVFDKIISLNGYDTQKMTHDQVIKEMSRNSTIFLQLEHSTQPLDSSTELTQVESQACLGNSCDNLPQNIEPGQEISVAEEARASQEKLKRRSFHVRSLTNYDWRSDRKVPGRSFSFYFGEILFVTNANDKNWWQAIPMISDMSGSSIDGNARPCAIIPSNENMKQRLSQPLGKKVRFDEKLVNEIKIQKKRKPSTKLKILASREGANNSDGGNQNVDLKRQKSYRRALMWSMTEDELHAALGTDNDATTQHQLEFDEENKKFVRVVDRCSKEVNSNGHRVLNSAVNAYQIVRRISLKYPRPIVLLGEYKKRLASNLISEQHDMFVSPRPSTSRLPKEGEDSESSYHFLIDLNGASFKTLFEYADAYFIEHGFCDKQLYGTTLQSVYDVALEGKHCVIDASPTTCLRLCKTDLYPVSILVKPPSVKWIQQVYQNYTRSECEDLYHKYQKMEVILKEHCTEIIIVDDYETLYEEVLEMIARNCDSPYAWIPTGEKI